MSKRYRLFTESFTTCFFKCSKNLERFWKIIFWILHTCNIIYIVTTKPSDFKHFKIFYNFHTIKQTF